ncbi:MULTISPECIES: hypothetical protein [Streptomyces]|uniref:Uncharacterized protein n=1 Tax=Streptomyces caniscabiei TaxID=2746961 RepID=A0A927QG16_9ACTN|nr:MULTISPECIES: hypothetical protein [Streptomyces]MBD9700838.1 hypothetical protein [Streptomyces caniscabiei]MBD9725006.1 hypothetical protein [Streptomyces caniscabiei]MBE4738270.1 hypothetical protein [Streptomyces caniscabiei]MBE4757032.1 hypothetical protein [Streptomyces caniscabiei]MBE4770314.1 hypothetical protein [Streptomyces caniscabiei]
MPLDEIQPEAFDGHTGVLRLAALALDSILTHPTDNRVAAGERRRYDSDQVADL